MPRVCDMLYDMLYRTDSIGVFQVDSWRQMTMLSKLRPRRYYDLVVKWRSCNRRRSWATWCIRICDGAAIREKLPT